MKKLQLLALMAFLLNTVNAFAVGDAGCGLGSLVFKDNKKLYQLLATTTNGTFGSQTFGITTGTSNCTASGFAKVDREQIFYVESNFQNLQVEMARGQGENLAAFAQVLGCKDMSVSEFGKMTREGYQRIFPTSKTTAVEVLDSVKKEIQSNKSLAEGCGQVG